MKNHFSLPIIILVLSVFYSCKKDDQQTTSTFERVNSMSSFNSAHRKPTQQFTLNAASGGSIITTGGVEFSFPSNAFVNSSGNAITGNIEVKIDEIISKADLIFNSISTHSNGRPLKSGGAFNIQVTQGSEILSVAPGKQYHVWLQSTYLEPTMETYYGINSSDQYGKINWTTTPPGAGPNVFTYSTDTSNVYEMILEDLNWINCDHPYDSLFAELNITLPDGSENSQITVLDNSAMFGVNLWGSNNTASWSYAPLNRSLTVIVLKHNNSSYNASVQNFLFSGQAITMPTFITIAEDDLEVLISTFQ